MISELLTRIEKRDKFVSDFEDLFENQAAILAKNNNLSKTNAQLLQELSAIKLQLDKSLKISAAAKESGYST